MKQKVVLVISVVVGLVAAILTRAYLSSKDAEVAEMKQKFYKRHGLMKVLCYYKNVPGGTVIDRSCLGERSVPSTGLRGQALTKENVGELVGRRVLYGHSEGEIVFWADIEGGDPRDSGLAADIKKGHRAMSVNCSGAATVSGMVKPNDHVDVIGSFTFPGANGRRDQGEVTTMTILQNVLVLATGKDTSKVQGRTSFGSSGASAGYSTVTLLVTPREAEMLAFTEQMRGSLTLTLRNRSDTTYEKDLPEVNYTKIKDEIMKLNEKRQQGVK